MEGSYASKLTLIQSNIGGIRYINLLCSRLQIAILANILYLSIPFCVDDKLITNIRLNYMSSIPLQISQNSAMYPRELLDLADPPTQLSWKGTDWKDFQGYARLAIVGSRKCSPYGRQVIENLVGALAPYKVVIISGLALGADSIAHRAALGSGLPTIAVLPTNVNNIYPASHRGLASDIVTKGGALIGEHTSNIPNMKYLFIARNRLVAALSQAVLVPEAALGSGSLHTVSFALELGRSVMAVPGSIVSLLSEGTNNLIKQGAVPVTNVQDILHTLDINPAYQKETVLVADSTEELTLLTLLKDGPLDGAVLHQTSHMSLPTYQQTLTLLEIKGRVGALGADTWHLKH